MYATHLYDLGLVDVSHIYLMPVQLVRVGDPMVQGVCTELMHGC